MSQNQMTKAEVQEYHDNQLLVLKYQKDMREVMAQKPHWNASPEKAKVLALNVEKGDKFGTWVWLTIVPEVGYVFVEQRPIEFINRI